MTKRDPPLWPDVTEESHRGRDFRCRRAVPTVAPSPPSAGSRTVGLSLLSDERCFSSTVGYTGQPPARTAAAAAKSLQSCPTLCDPIDGSPLGSSVPGILQARYWSGLPFPSPMRESEVTQSCPTLSDPMDCSLPGSSVHEIFQARVLEWGIGK